MRPYFTNLFILFFLFFTLHTTTAQQGSIDLKSYTINLKKPGQIKVEERIKLMEEEAQAFDPSAYISQHLEDWDIVIYGFVKTDDEVLRYQFNSAELITGRECQVYCEEILKIERLPFLGVSAEDHEAFEGAIIKSVVTDSGAKKAGLLPGDLIIAVGTTSIHTGCELKIAIRKYNVGDEINITFIRDGKELVRKVVLGYRLSKKMTWVPCCNGIAEGTTIPDPFLPNSPYGQIKLFPNPSEGISHLHFSSELKEDIQILVTDVNGRSVLQEESIDFDGTIDQYLDLSEEAAGIYFVNIIQGDMVFVERLVVQKQ